MNKKVGRPRGKHDNRDKIINAAKALFIDKEYNKVTMRDIAAQAGSDPGLIRYYFGSKESLFVTMLKETIDPVFAQMNAICRLPKVSSLADLMSTYYQVMAVNPNFPKLMYRLLSMEQQPDQLPEIFSLTLKVTQSQQHIIFETLKKEGKLYDDVDIKCAQLSFISLTIFPFLAPSILLDTLGISITPQFMTKHAAQNNSLLNHGLFNKDTHNESQ